MPSQDRDESTDNEMSGHADHVVQARDISGPVQIVGKGVAHVGDISGDLNLTIGRD